MPQVGPLEILVIFVVALIVFGPTKLPQIGRQLGRGLRELRKFQESLRRDLDDVLADDEDERSTAAPTLPPGQPPVANESGPPEAAPGSPPEPAS